MHVTIPYSSGTVETVITPDGNFDLLVPVYPSSGEITNPGEIAISTLDGYEAICIKSDQNENVLFSNDAANREKLGLWYNSEDGGLALGENRIKGPVLSLSEGVPLDNRPIIIDRKHGNTATLFVTGHEMIPEEIGFSLTPLKDSESCVIYGYDGELPYNLSDMKDIKLNISIGRDDTLELVINKGTDIRELQFTDPERKGFLCDSIHGLENVPPVQIGDGTMTGQTVPGYRLKYTVSGDITASFTTKGEPGCMAVASHAEGPNTVTYTVGSHTEGMLTNAPCGQFSHCEGFRSSTSGQGSSVHNSESNTKTGATASSVYGYSNSVTNVGEFACGLANGFNVLEERLFSVGDGSCLEYDDSDDPPTLQATPAECITHDVFKVLMNGDGNNSYYYPFFDLSKQEKASRGLVITATVTVNNQPTTLTKTLGDWYNFLISGGN